MVRILNLKKTFKLRDYDSMRLEAGLINSNEKNTGNDVESDWSWLKIFFEEMKNKFISNKNWKIIKNNWITRAVIKSRRAKKKHGSGSNNLKMIK